MNHKRNFAVILICVMIMGLTACGNRENKTLEEPLQGESNPIEAEENHTEPDAKVKDKKETSSSTSGEEEQPGQSEEDDNLDQKLSEYRAKRESMTGVALGGGTTGYSAPNEEDYGFTSSEVEYIRNFDSRELNEAYEAAKKYVEETLELSVETKSSIYSCVDPRMTEIYEAEDKGVAEGYEPENIFLCEYCDNGNWQYLILVREAKGKKWSVIHHGSTYLE